MKAQWNDSRFGIRTLNAAGFTGTVAWSSDGGGYTAKFENWTLKTKFADQQDAMRAVEALARRKATELLEALKVIDR